MEVVYMGKKGATVHTLAAQVLAQVSFSTVDQCLSLSSWVRQWWAELLSCTYGRPLGMKVKAAQGKTTCGSIAKDLTV